MTPYKKLSAEQKKQLYDKRRITFRSIETISRIRHI